jgi:hypothetical protein
MPLTLENVLDRVVSQPALIRRLKDKGVLRVMDAGKVVEVPYEKTQAGYVNFHAADETMRLKLPHAPRTVTGAP